MKSFSITLYLYLFLSSAMIAQVSINGILSIEAKKGGRDSHVLSNGVFNSNGSIYVNSLSLFFENQPDENIFLSAYIQSDLGFSSRLQPFRIYRASVFFLNLWSKSLNIEAGRILSPFGKYLQNQLPVDHPLINSPLLFQYHSNVSRLQGYFRDPKSSRTDNNAGLSIIYPGGYYSGVRIFGSFAEELFEYSAAFTTTPLSSNWGEVDLNKRPAFSGRVAHNPFPFLEYGVSYAQGAYLDNSPINNMTDAGKYIQQTTGADITVSYLYYSLTAEHIINSWEAPAIRNIGGINTVIADNLVLKNTFSSAEVKIESPVLPAWYFAARYELLRFNEIQDPDFAGNTIRWDENLSRWEAGIGYKFGPKVKMKASYSGMRNDDRITDLEDDIIALQLNVEF